MPEKKKKLKIDSIGDKQKDDLLHKGTKDDPIPIKDRGEAKSNKTYIVEE